jgi:hypothetical protein
MFIHQPAAKMRSAVRVSRLPHERDVRILERRLANAHTADLRTVERGEQRVRQLAAVRLDDEDLRLLPRLNTD